MLSEQPCAANQCRTISVKCSRDDDDDDDDGYHLLKTWQTAGQLLAERLSLLS